jgi:hypothetical protein
MAKPFAERVGSGLHVHVSLVDRDGRNVFAGPADPKIGRPISDTLRHAVGGLLATMPEAMAIFAPNANSYRRLRPGTYAPVKGLWGGDNRTVPLRIPGGGEESVRIEHRVAGADANPYLVVATVLAGIHHGIANSIAPRAHRRRRLCRRRRRAAADPLAAGAAAVRRRQGAEALSRRGLVRGLPHGAQLRGREPPLHHPEPRLRVVSQNRMSVLDATSYYQATATPYDPFPALEDSIEADVAVVGAGFTGLSAALELRARGFTVAVLDQGTIAWGASGRNGGQICTGFSPGLAPLEAALGREAAQACFDVSEEAKDLIGERIARYGIDCDLKPGQLICATRRASMAGLARHHDDLASYGYSKTCLLTKAELEERLATTAYCGALKDEGAGHFHPLNYAIGLARALKKEGGLIFENSKVVEIRQGPRPVVVSEMGEVRARFVVMACNAYVDGLNRQIDPASCRWRATSSPPSRWATTAPAPSSATTTRCRIPISSSTTSA